MGQVLRADNIPQLTFSGNTITLAATNLGLPTRITINGQQYVLSGSLLCNLNTTGLGALDTGTIALNTLYRIYAVVVNSAVGLVASVASLPAGYSNYREIGRSRTSLPSAAIASVNLYLNGLPASRASEPYELATSFQIEASSNPTHGSGSSQNRYTTRDGSYAIIRWEFNQASGSTGGTAGTGVYRVPLPSLLYVDPSRLGFVGAVQIQNTLVGEGLLTVGGVNYKIIPQALGSTPGQNFICAILMNDTVAVADWSSTLGQMGAGTYRFGLEVRVPIREWSGVFD